MIQIKPISGDTMAAYRAVRLAALRDSPLAFGSTYENESRLSDAEWVERARRWNGDRSCCYLAWDNTRPCGIVAGLMDAPPLPGVHLVSMWVAPTHRRLGIGRQLVGAVVTWAADHGVGPIYLFVTSINDVATHFYERLGFTKTGKTAPYPNDPTIVELEMVRLGGPPLD